MLPTRIEYALKVIPPATSGDSRTTYINPPLSLEQGELVGTSVGIAPSNIFIDFGLYDVRTPNNVIPNPAWLILLPPIQNSGTSAYVSLTTGPETRATMRSRPTGKEGKTSDHCD